MIWEILAIRLEDDRLIPIYHSRRRPASFHRGGQRESCRDCLSPILSFPVIGQGRRDSPLGSLLSMGAGTEFGYHVCPTTWGARNPTPGRHSSAPSVSDYTADQHFHQTKQTRWCAKTLESCQVNGQVVRGGDSAPVSVACGLRSFG
jgi:hypothetical protein